MRGSKISAGWTNAVEFGPRQEERKKPPFKAAS